MKCIRKKFCSDKNSVAVLCRSYSHVRPGQCVDILNTSDSREIWFLVKIQTILSADRKINEPVLQKEDEHI